MSSFSFGNTTTQLPGSYTLLDFSAVTLPVAIDLERSTATIGGTAISFDKSKLQDLVLGASTRSVNLPSGAWEFLSTNPDNTSQYNLSLKEGGNLSITGGAQAVSRLSFSGTPYNHLFLDYASDSIRLDANLITLENKLHIATSIQNTSKNLAVMGTEFFEFSVGLQSSNLVAYLRASPLYDIRPHLDNIVFLPGNGDTIKPASGVLTLGDYGSQTGVVNASFIGASLVSSTIQDDIHIGSRGFAPLAVLSSRGNDLYVSRNPLDVLTFWDDFQGTKSGAYPVITVDLKQGYAIDGYGNRDTLVGISNVEGSFRNPMTITGSDSDNSFWVYGHGDRIDGGAGTDILGTSLWDFSVDFANATLRDASGAIAVHFSNIEGVITQGKINVTGDAKNNIVAVENGRGGIIRLDAGDDTVVFTQTLWGDGYTVSIDGGTGTDRLFAYATFEGSTIRTASTGLQVSLNSQGRLREYVDWTNANETSKNSSRLPYSKGVVDLVSVEEIRFIDGIYDTRSGHFTAQKTDFSLANQSLRHRLAVDHNQDSFSTPAGFGDLPNFGNSDLRIDQPADAPVTTGVGNDVVVSRHPATVSTNAGNDSVAVIGPRSHLLLGPGDDLAAIGTRQDNSTIDGGDGFDVAVFLSLDDHQKSKITLSGVEVVYVQHHGFKNLVPAGQTLIAPFLQPELATQTPDFDKYVFRGDVVAGATTYHLLSNEHSALALLVPLREGWIRDDSGVAFQQIGLFNLGNQDFDRPGSPDALVVGTAGVDVLSTRTTPLAVKKDGNLGIVELANGKRIYTDAIEKVQFADKTINLMVRSTYDDLPQAVAIRVSELYVAFFNRTPDGDGLAYWLLQAKAGVSIGPIAEAFYTAGIQYSALTGFSAGMTNADFVNVLYKNVLGRSEGADAGGLTHWTTELAIGRATRASLVSSVLDSAHSFKGDAKWGWVADLLDNKIAVAKQVAVDWGLNFATPEDSVSKGIAIAKAVTPQDTAAAIGLVGIPPGVISLE